MKHFRMQNLILIAFFIALICMAWIGYWRVLGIQARIISDTNSRLSQILGHSPVFPRPTVHGYWAKTFQTGMENATGYSFLFYERLIPFLTNWKSLVYETFLETLPKSWSPVLPIGGKDYVMIRGRQQPFPTPAVYNKEMAKQMQNAADYYNKIATQWPELRFYVFVIPAKQMILADTGVWPAVSTQLLQGCKALDHFKTLLFDSVAYGWANKGRLPEEMLRLYYNSDHHLTMPGAYEVYCQLHNLISSTGIDIGKAIQCKNWFVVPNVNFMGSDARSSGYFGSVTDELIDGLFTLPDYKVNIHGSKQCQVRNKRLQYERGKVPDGRFANHYAEYFGNDHGLIEYVVGQTSRNRNLLVIGDSYKTPIEPLLSAHFSHTYFVDLRHFSGDLGYSFDLDSFISQNSITDVLFLGSVTTVMSDKKGQES